MYKLESKNHIIIGSENITFQNEITIQNITKLKNVICFNTFPSEENLDWHKLETHEIWKKRCENNPSELYSYNLEGRLIWKFADYPVVGFEIINIELLSTDDFISEKHYTDYIKRFKDLEILAVYAGDWRFVIDANSGEIYSQNESR